MKYLIFVCSFFLVTGCDQFQAFQEQASQQFAEQHFISAVAHIELHKTRNGSYPNNLDQIKFLGGWDQAWLSSVKYEKQNRGYNLFLPSVDGSEVGLAFPEEFFRGLGLKQTNVKRAKKQ